VNRALSWEAAIPADIWTGEAGEGTMSSVSFGIPRLQTWLDQAAMNGGRATSGWENEIMKRDLIWIAVAAVTLAFPSIIHAESRDMKNARDDIKAARSLPDSPVIEDNRIRPREEPRETRRREAQERLDAANKRYEKALNDLDRTIKNNRARREQAREVWCNRLSQRAALDWSASAAARYETYCAN
jgi:hypothetical protein